MHPEMLPSLVAERHRDIAASMPARRAPARRGPSLRVSWSLVTLAAQAGAAAGRGRSWVIVISATRPL